MEHKSVLVPFAAPREARRRGHDADTETPEGFIDPEELRGAIRAEIEARLDRSGKWRDRPVCSDCRPRAICASAAFSFTATSRRGPGKVPLDLTNVDSGRCLPQSFMVRKESAGMIVRRGIGIEPVMLGVARRRRPQWDGERTSVVGMARAFWFRDK